MIGSSKSDIVTLGRKFRLIANFMVREQVFPRHCEKIALWHLGRINPRRLQPTQHVFLFNADMIAIYKPIAHWISDENVAGGKNTSISSKVGFCANVSALAVFGVCSTD